MITRQLRNQFANASTSNGNYFPTKGHAVASFADVLGKFSLQFDETQFSEFHGDEGRETLRICDVCNHEVGQASVTWHRMPSGRYEVTGYIT